MKQIKAAIAVNKANWYLCVKLNKNNNRKIKQKTPVNFKQ